MKNIFHFPQKKNPRRASMERSFIRRIGHEPKVDWMLIVIFSTILLVVLLVMGVFLYKNLDQRLNQTVSVPNTSAIMTVDTKGLTQVLKEYSDRVQMRDSILRGYNGPADPSQ